MGEDPLTASLVGSREIGFTIVSMTLSLAAVFIPVLFMGGVVGRLLHEFAVTIAVAILPASMSKPAAVSCNTRPRSSRTPTS